jgi:hypothetical protein
VGIYLSIGCHGPFDNGVWQHLSQPILQGCRHDIRSRCDTALVRRSCRYRARSLDWPAIQRALLEESSEERGQDWNRYSREREGIALRMRKTCYALNAAYADWIASHFAQARSNIERIFLHCPIYLKTATNPRLYPQDRIVTCMIIHHHQHHQALLMRHPPINTSVSVHLSNSLIGGIASS